MIHRTFDRRSKQLDAQLANFQSELQAMEKRVAPAVLVTRTRKDGHFFHVTVLAAVRSTSIRVTTDFVEAWTPY